jgi:hypothetical protein
LLFELGVLSKRIPELAKHVHAIAVNAILLRLLDLLDVMRQFINQGQNHFVVVLQKFDRVHVTSPPYIRATENILSHLTVQQTCKLVH